MKKNYFAEFCCSNKIKKLENVTYQILFLWSPSRVTSCLFDS